MVIGKNMNKLIFQEVQEKMVTGDTADEKIKQLYESAFPEDEQIPWKDRL